MKSEDDYKKLSSPEVIQFIEENLSTPIPELILKGSPFDSIEINLLVNQIIGRNKAKKKLPTWYRNQKIIYPPKINLEQSSSEITARHKSKFIEGDKLIDLTGGFGVDDYYFSKKISELTYSELNSDVFEIAKNNFNVLSVKNIVCHNQDSIKLLQDSNHKYNWIYVDPSRRNKNQKVFLLKDSLPNLLEHQKLLKEKSFNVMIKTSPMYDIEMGFKELSGIKELHIISVKNEVKELLWIIDWRSMNQKMIKMFNYESLKRFTFNQVIKEANNDNEVEINTCQDYMYEFNSSIMKSGLNDHFALKYNLFKLNENTHLYTSKSLLKSFPGKIYKIESTESINYKKLKKMYKGKFINVISKNFKLSALHLKNKIGFKTGTDTDYLIFTKTIEGNRVILATRLITTKKWLT